MSNEQQIGELVQRWADGERANDSAAIEPLLADEFRGIGPWGFILDRRQWLDRFAGGVFRNDEFTVDEVTVRDFGDVAVVIGRQTQKATYDGHPSDGSFRLSQLWISGRDGWRVAHAQLSHIAGPPAS